MWEIIYYETENGNCPVYEFINDLPVKMRAKAFKELELLESLGIQIKMPYSRPLQDGLHELRIQAGNDISRIFYFFYIGRRIILTNGFVKKTQTTPRREIDKALKYKADYERRFTDET